MNRTGFLGGMASCPLNEMVRYLDGYLRAGEIADYAEAHNGLQLENAGAVTKIAAAVDACGYTVEHAAALGADLLLVHHGLFWGGIHPMTGRRYRMWKRAMDAGIAVYGSHLPLDVHPEVGNNARLCAALGLGETEPFLSFKGMPIGLSARFAGSREELTDRLRAAVNGAVRVCPGGPEAVRAVGVVTGGAGAEVRAAAAARIDTFITGEGPHWTYALAEELGVNILYGGHYATETFGVRALAAHLEQRFGLPWVFLDHPTGL